MRDTSRDAVALAGARLARAKLNHELAERQYKKAMDDAIANPPKRVRMMGPKQPTMYAVRLVETGYQRLSMIKLVREYTHLGLLEAKNMVEAAGSDNHPTIKDQVSFEFANELAMKIMNIGGKAELVRQRRPRRAE